MNQNLAVVYGVPDTSNSCCTSLTAPNNHRPPTDRLDRPPLNAHRPHTHTYRSSRTTKRNDRFIKPPTHTLLLTPPPRSIMPKANEKTKLVKNTKLTAGEKKKIKNENKAKANPAKAAAKKGKNDAKRERR